VSTFVTADPISPAAVDCKDVAEFAKSLPSVGWLKTRSTLVLIRLKMR